MKQPHIAIALTLFFLADCNGAAGTQNAAYSGGALPSVAQRLHAASAGLTELVNLNYSDGTITVFTIQNGTAKVTKSFAPGHGIAQGLAVDGSGRIYTTITPSDSKPCIACVEIFTDGGKLVRRLDAPTLQGASGAPSLTDVALDRKLNVYVSDYGQQAVYFFPHARAGTPTVVVQNSDNAASVLATPNGDDVAVSGGCGFASVRPYTRNADGGYTSGACFSIGTIALIGGATDNGVDVMTPVDGVTGLVAVSSPSGGTAFHTPDRLHASISGVAFNRDASIAYVANAAKECVYAFARPAAGWLSGKPKLVATYKGFEDLDIIAVRQ
jgi:hypothetical protein